MTWIPGTPIVSEQDHLEWDAWRRECILTAQRHRRSRLRPPEAERELFRRLARIDKSLLLLCRVVLMAASVAVAHFITRALETSWIGELGAFGISLVAVIVFIVYIEKDAD
jgi:hypothetical protein